MIGELKEQRAEVFNVEYIQNGLANLQNLKLMFPQLGNHPFFNMALEQIENGLGPEYKID